MSRSDCDALAHSIKEDGPAFVTDDGEVSEIPDLPEDLGRVCALASEATLRKFWGTPQEDTAWQHT